MIVKNAADVERFIQEDGRCGVAGQFCSQSCEKHGKHVAITNGRIFAVGTSLPTVSVASHLAAQAA